MFLLQQRHSQSGNTEVLCMDKVTNSDLQFFRQRLARLYPDYELLLNTVPEPEETYATPSF